MARVLPGVQLSSFVTVIQMRLISYSWLSSYAFDYVSNYLGERDMAVFMVTMRC